ncbi:hypothetical protein JHK84_051612 [Glycine max]|nr:hypothetical protein JHK84_051612 [Glycine max]
MAAAVKRFNQLEYGKSSLIKLNCSASFITLIGEVEVELEHALLLNLRCNRIPVEEIRQPIIGSKA